MHYKRSKEKGVERAAVHILNVGSIIFAMNLGMLNVI